MRQRGGCLSRVTRWHRWQHPGQSSGPKHQSEWTPQPLSKTSVTSRRRHHLRKNNAQCGSGHVEKLSKALKGVLQANAIHQTLWKTAAQQRRHTSIQGFLRQCFVDIILLNDFLQERTP